MIFAERPQLGRNVRHTLKPGTGNTKGDLTPRQVPFSIIRPQVAKNGSHTRLAYGTISTMMLLSTGSVGLGSIIRRFSLAAKRTCGKGVSPGMSGGMSEYKPKKERTDKSAISHCF